MRCQRKILRIVCFQHVSNKHIRSLTKQPEVSKVIRNRRLKWFGHLLRLDNERIPKRLHLWKPTHGRRRRRRPRTMWTSVIQRDLLNLGLGWSVEEAEIAAQDRIGWTILTSQAASADMHDTDWYFVGKQVRGCCTPKQKLTCFVLSQNYQHLFEQFLELEFRCSRVSQFVGEMYLWMIVCLFVCLTGRSVRRHTWVLVGTILDQKCSSQAKKA